MQLTETQREILFNAWCLSHVGCGQVLHDEYIPAAHQLVEAGWLERRIEDDQLTWWWSAPASTALELDALVSDQSVN